MELKDRKRIQNTLPRFNLGTEAAMATVNSQNTFGLTQNTLPDEKMGLMNMENSMLKSGQFVGNSSGGVEPNMLAQKAAGGSKTGAFLKNNAGNIANAAMSAINFASTIGGLSKNTMSSDEMMGSGGTTQQSANGIGYTESRVDDAGIQKQIDATASAATMTGAQSGAALGGSIGTIFGPLGTGIGTLAGGLLGGVAGLFGGKKAKEEAERQKRIAINRTNAANAQNREQAYTIGLRNEFNRENRTDTSQSLFHADLGKEKLEVNPVTGKTFQNTLIYTAHGPAIGPQGGWGGKGEVITDDLGYGYEIPTGPNDTAKIDVDDGGSVYSLHVKNPSTGNSIAHDAKILLRAGNGKMSISDKNWLDMNQRVGKMMMYAGKKKKTNTNPGYLGGTLKKFNLGDEDYDLSAMKAAYYNSPEYRDLQYGSSIVPKKASSKGNGLNKLWGGIKSVGSTIGSVLGPNLGNLAVLGNAYALAAQREARAKGIHRANSQALATNIYGDAAVERLSGLKQDYYPVLSKNRETEARIWNGIRNSGGLSAGQSALFGALLSNQTQQNNADAIFNSQMANNQLVSQAEKAKIALGDSNATRSMQGYQWDTDYFAKGHAANENKLETSAYDRQNALSSFISNLFDRYQFDQMMGLYKDQQKIDRKKLQNIMKGLR